MTARTACRNAPKNCCITKHNEKPPGIRWLLQFLFCQTSENFQSWKFSRTCQLFSFLVMDMQVPYSNSTFTGRPVSMDLLQARVKLTDLNASR